MTGAQWIPVRALGQRHAERHIVSANICDMAWYIECSNLSPYYRRARVFAGYAHFAHLLYIFDDAVFAFAGIGGGRIVSWSMWGCNRETLRAADTQIK